MKRHRLRHSRCLHRSTWEPETYYRTCNIIMSECRPGNVAKKKRRKRAKMEDWREQTVHDSPTVVLCLMIHQECRADAKLSCLSSVTVAASGLLILNEGWISCAVSISEGGRTASLLPTSMERRLERMSHSWAEEGGLMLLHEGRQEVLSSRLVNKH